MTSIFGKTESDIDLEQRTFATLRAVKGQQFGRDIYTTVLKFKDLANFLGIFPMVQRDILPRKVRSIRRYILDGLRNDEPINMKFFSAVTVSCRGNIFYNSDIAKLSIDTFETKLSINDGQHRFEAIKTTLEMLEDEFVKSKNKERTSEIKKWIDDLGEMVIPIVIFDGLTEKEEKQLFHDLNNLAQRPSRNANIRLNQTDLYSKMARELAESNRYLDYYGVEVDKMSIFGSNPNTILLSTIYESIKELLGVKRRRGRIELNEENYEEIKAEIDDTFTKLFSSLPGDMNVKDKYIIDKSYTIRSISRFIREARNNEELMIDDDTIFKVISDMDWTHNLEFWSKYNAIEGSKNNIVFAGGTGGGLISVYNALIDRLQEIRESNN